MTSLFVYVRYAVKRPQRVIEMSFHSTLHIENLTGLVKIDIWALDSREKDDLIPKSNSIDLSKIQRQSRSQSRL